MDVVDRPVAGADPLASLSYRPGPVRLVAAAVILFLALQQPAQAYIGPGAGFALLSSFLVIFLAMLSAFFFAI